MTRNVITLNVDKHKKQKYNLDFLTNYEMFYADPAKIKEVTEGIEREDSSLSSDSRGDGCMISDD